jgi:nucleoid-associated protein YgaU
VPKTATKVVSRGDSLWRISRVTYGDGKRYAVLYKANRGHIRDPNRIFPGQIVVLPTTAR